MGACKKERKTERGVEGEFGVVNRRGSQIVIGNIQERAQKKKGEIGGGEGVWIKEVGKLGENEIGGRRNKSCESFWKEVRKKEKVKIQDLMCVKWLRRMGDGRRKKQREEMEKIHSRKGFEAEAVGC